MRYRIHFGFLQNVSALSNERLVVKGEVYIKTWIPSNIISVIIQLRRLVHKERWKICLLYVINR